MIKFLISLSLLSATIAGAEFVAVQIGNDIDGEHANAFSGDGAISLNRLGSILAIGAIGNTGASGSGAETGHVRVYRWNVTTMSWSQLGSDIDGAAAGDTFGGSVSLSADGTRFAVGAPQNDGPGDGSADKCGEVQVYEFDGSSWAKLGGDINGEAANDRLGNSVSLSADGTRVAIGAYLNDGPGDGSQDNVGEVQVYTYDGSAWAKLSNDIVGESPNDHFGTSVSLSADGTRVAIGAPQYSNSKGHVRVYEYTTAWTKLGNDIDGDNVHDKLGKSVSLSADGTHVAVGAPFDVGDDGYVRVFMYDGTAWVQVGDDIDGEAAGDQSGTSVSLDSAGTRVAIGSPGATSLKGQVRVFQWNETAWEQLVDDIDGEAAGDSSGYSLALSTLGTRVAIGAPANSGSAQFAGHVRVYEIYDDATTTTTTVQGYALISNCHHDSPTWVAVITGCMWWLVQ